MAGIRDHHTRRRTILTVALVLAVMAGVGVYGLVARPHQGVGSAAPRASESASPTPTASPSNSTAAVSALPALPETGDAVRFARAVANALFTWDTGSGRAPTDYTQVLVAAGDPSGVDSAGLASDLTTYLPTADTWARLRQYGTRQWLTIDTAQVPDSWAQAKAQAAPGLLAPGTIVYTITGIRHREGVFDGQAVTSVHSVSFTVFLACQPTYDTCHLLRLSALDNPLK